jgi:NosR/NirI family nitrous oxide reductase transcriptional regulator
MRLGSLAAVALALFVPLSASSQQTGVDPAQMEQVFPAATRFGPATGTPPFYRAYGPDPSTGAEVVLGYIFLTSDWPPLEEGYNGPITSLVGVDTKGQITGMRVIEYHESLQSSRGDFLRGPFEMQFAGKGIADAFRIRRDVDNVSGATITSAAAARAVRNAGRRVLAAVGGGQQAELTREDIARLDWPDLVLRGLGDRLFGTEDGVLVIDLHLIPIEDEAMGRLLLGNDAYDRGMRRLGTRAAERPVWMIGLDGNRAGQVRWNTLTLVRGADTLRFTMSDLYFTGAPRGGKAEGELRNAGLLLVDPSIDPKQNFTWRLDLGGDFQPFTVDHVGDPTVLVAEAPPLPVESPPATLDAASDARVASETAAMDAASAEVADVQIEPAEVAPVLDPMVLDFAAETEETVLRRTLAQTHWVRFGLLVFLLTLASAAFFSKLIWLRRAALGATLLIMGVGSAQWADQFGGGGFLSVSHITAAIKVGPGVFLGDLPLLLLVVFTVAATLLWGRVFCGYLCPFGVLQDFIEHLVPKRLRRKLPHPVHESGLYVKYGVLGVILVPAIAGSDAVIFQYFEPFGTVFFWSSSTVLWLIAGAVLIGSAIIPRFYCRYLCPLGAALALGSLVSPFRIKRVQQCTLCTVCEHVCPTGAIQRESIDFRECVRCNACEVKLVERAGVCRHDMDKVAHLIQIKRDRDHPTFPLPEAVGGD